MTNIIRFKTKPLPGRELPGAQALNNVISLADHRKRPHPVRTPNGVFFVTNVWGTPGDAA
jgi:hypothetical protein